MTTRLLSLMMAALLAACGSGSGSGSGPTGPTSSADTAPAGTLTFRASPIDPSAIRWITPLGNLNPPGHTTPTDHIYFYFADPDAGESIVGRRTDFFAPGDGIVNTVFGGVGQETKLFIRQTSTFTYYIDHLILSAPLTRGSTVTAGQLLGTTGEAYGIDLGVRNDAITVNLLVPRRYPSDTIHTDAPLKYFEEPLRSQLYARVRTLGPNLDGRIDFDVAGRLSGNWFAGETAAVSFAYDTYDQSRVFISVGAGAVLGVFTIAPGDPQPVDVSKASGRILYTLNRAVNVPGRLPPPGPAAYMLVEMIDDSHIRMQMFTATSIPDGFTDRAATLSR
jgi:hypothetical protein